jgi:hypothetical protein
VTIRQLLQNILGYGMLLAGIFLLSQSSQYPNPQSNWKNIYIINVETRVDSVQKNQTTTVTYKNLPSGKQDQFSVGCYLDTPLGCDVLHDPYIKLINRRVCTEFVGIIIFNPQPQCPNKNTGLWMLWGGILLIVLGSLIAGLNRYGIHSPRLASIARQGV